MGVQFHFFSQGSELEDRVKEDNGFNGFLAASLRLLDSFPMYIIRIEASRPESPSLQDCIQVKFQASPYSPDHVQSQVMQDPSNIDLYFEAMTEWKSDEGTFIPRFLEANSILMGNLTIGNTEPDLPGAQLGLFTNHPIVRTHKSIDNRGSLIVMYGPEELPDILRGCVFGYERRLQEFLHQNHSYTIEVRYQYVRRRLSDEEDHYLVSYYLAPGDSRFTHIADFPLREGIGEIILRQEQLSGRKPFDTELCVKSRFATETELRKYIQSKIDYLFLSSSQDLGENRSSIVRI